jgi:hypothetical protein
MSLLGRGKLRLLFDFEAALFITAGCFAPVLVAVHTGWFPVRLQYGCRIGRRFGFPVVLSPVYRQLTTGNRERS